MPDIIFVEPSGEEKTVNVANGAKIRDAAIENGIEGIIGACGGNGMCATCHGYLEESFLTKVPNVEEDEEAMLEEAKAEVKSNSRLTCQVLMSAELEGMRVTFPAQQ
jgi:ferredoxin, 2Fe-2S